MSRQPGIHPKLSTMSRVENETGDWLAELIDPVTNSTRGFFILKNSQDNFSSINKPQVGSRKICQGEIRYESQKILTGIQREYSKPSRNVKEP